MRSVRVNVLIRVLVLFLIFLASPLAAEEYGKWIPASNTKYAEMFNEPIAIAKQWAGENIDAKSGKFNFEYHPVEAEDGYIVYIDPVYLPNENGELKIVSDDEWCVFINAQNVIRNVAQCLSP